MKGTSSILLSTLSSPLCGISQSTILGNLAWAYLQQNNYSSAKKHYRVDLEVSMLDITICSF
ncbi:hypothetical protein CFP56_001271 [Quercus suber]|uniref:Uncharacterized protein n=1 Tax=Quercus suber TaxID=58331 RepID=A0AAW0IMY0_QUESU